MTTVVAQASTVASREMANGRTVSSIRLMSTPAIAEPTPIRMALVKADATPAIWPSGVIAAVFIFGMSSMNEDSVTLLVVGQSSCVHDAAQAGLGCFRLVNLVGQIEGPLFEHSWWQALIQHPRIDPRSADLVG